MDKKYFWFWYGSSLVVLLAIVVGNARDLTLGGKDVRVCVRERECVYVSIIWFIVLFNSAAEDIKFIKWDQEDDNEHWVRRIWK